MKKVESLLVLDKLQAYAVTSHILDQQRDKNTNYFILILDTTEKKVNIRKYTEFSDASEEYSQLDSKHKDDNDKDVVLVSADSIKALKTAYPNYFADTTRFREQIRILIANKRKQINL